MDSSHPSLSIYLHPAVVDFSILIPPSLSIFVHKAAVSDSLLLLLTTSMAISSRRMGLIPTRVKRRHQNATHSSQQFYFKKGTTFSQKQNFYGDFLKI